jgi:hypothetical protein
MILWFYCAVIVDDADRCCVVSIKMLYLSMARIYHPLSSRHPVGLCYLVSKIIHFLNHQLNFQLDIQRDCLGI